MIIIYNKQNYLWKYLTKVPICFCLPSSSLNSGTWSVSSVLYTQWTLNNHMYSVRQYLWKLGQGDNIILAVISTLFCPEMELISVRFPRSQDRAKLKKVKSSVYGAAWSFCSYSQAAWHTRTCSQVLHRPRRAVNRMHISLKRTKSSRIPPKHDLSQP